MTMIVYTDGSCLGNPGPGGWAWAVAPTGERCGWGAEPLTTNQRMEITAVLEAVKLNGDVIIVTDSRYVADCMRDGWWKRWRRNGWRTTAGTPVANRDLWEQLVDAWLEHHPQITWTKGHGSDPMNELVDRLARAAALSARRTTMV